MKTIFIFIASVLVFTRASDWYLYEESFDSTSLQPSDLEGWKFEGNTGGNELTNCGDVSIVGGFGSTGKGATIQKRFTDIPNHYKIKIAITAFFIDSWDNERFQIMVNGQEVFSELSNVAWHTPMCGVKGWGERVATLEVEVAHFQSNVLIGFQSTLNEKANNESWGIRDFQLLVKKCEENCQVVAQEFSGEWTNKDVHGWTPSREIKGGLQNDCDGNKILGGFGKFGQKLKLEKTFKKLPKHYRLVIAFDLWQIDSWDGNEAFRLVVDGKTGFSQIKTKGAYGGDYQCGHKSFKDQKIEASVEVPHFGSSVHIMFQDSLNENVNNESWGISNFRIYAISCEGNCSRVAEELVDDSFSNEALVGWTDKKGKTFDRTTSCSRISLAGGYNELAGAQISKTYKKLPKHSHLMFGIEIWLIDSWDNEKFTITVDQVPGITTTKSKGTWKLDIGSACGDSSKPQWKDEIQILWVEVPHFEDQATITLISKLNQSPQDESWGFRNVHVYVRDEFDDEKYAQQITKDFTKDQFKSYSKKWAMAKPVKAKVIQSDCGGKQIIGGYNTFSGKSSISRSWKNLKEHDYVIFYFKAYFIDSWDKEAFLAQIDGSRRKQITKMTFNTLDSQQLCGWGAQAEDVYFAEIKFAHNKPDLKLEIFTMLNEAANNESWGIRDFHMFIGKDRILRPDCPTLYTECNYEGESFNLCNDIEDFSKVDWTRQVHSVWVPEGWEATLYENAKYDGKKHVFKAPVQCLKEGPAYNFIRLHGPKRFASALAKKHNQLNIKQNNHHLKKNANHHKL